jgi:hypothetical protein
LAGPVTEAEHGDEQADQPESPSQGGRGTAQAAATVRHRDAGRTPDPLEPVGLFETPAEQRQRRQRDQRQPEQAPPAERGAGHPPHDRDEAGPAIPGGRHQGEGLGPVAAAGLLGRDHPADGVRAHHQ